MTLGERIRSLRTARGLSQEALAEKLDVSRQSLSKWETDASIPELDKLLLLRDIFGISLDALVTGETPESTAADAARSAVPFPQTQRIIGYILLCAGLLCCILDFIFVRGLLFLGGYLVLCGILCLTVRQHAVLIIGWMSAAFCFLFITYFTGINVFSFLYHALALRKNMNPAQLLIPLLVWGAFLLLLFFTARALLRHLRRDQ